MLRIRDMAGRSLEVVLYSFAMSRGSGLYFFYFNPPRPAGTPPIFPYGNTGGEEGSTGFGNEVGYRSFFFAVL